MSQLWVDTESARTAFFSGARVCFSVVNKRVSYFQSTQCIADVSQVSTQETLPQLFASSPPGLTWVMVPFIMQPFTLRGFVPGVWRARAYLVASGREEDTHWKGGHDDILGSDDQGKGGWLLEEGLVLLLSLTTLAASCRQCGLS